jgi:thiol:disulfide interchange protein DsbD
MGTPLLLVGASAGKLLPRAGAWMETVKNVFGVLFLAVAAWMLSRIAPSWAILPLWAIPAFALAWVLWNAVRKPTPARVAWRTVAVVSALYGVSLLSGAALGSTNPLAPIPQLAAAKTPLEFKRIKSLADLEREVAAARAAGKGVMLDFYADWCVSCKEMEHNTFNEPAVKKALANTITLQADVTANDAQDKELLQHFGIFGPPTIAFYSVDGTEQRNFRVVGFMKADEFSEVARRAVAGLCKQST